VRDDLIREHRICGERDEGGEEEAGDDCGPDEVHDGEMGFGGNEGWGMGQLNRWGWCMLGHIL